MSTHPLELERLRLDGGTQPRSELDEPTVQGYMEAMAGGDVFPPIVVCYDGTDYWLVDGFHRVEAAMLSGFAVLQAIIHQGTIEDAQWMSFGVNATHALPRSNADKRRAVEAALKHVKGQNLSNAAIAKHCHTSDHFVGVVRQELGLNSDPIGVETRIGLDGKTRRMPQRPSAVDARVWPVPNEFGVFVGCTDLGFKTAVDVATVRLMSLETEAGWRAGGNIHVGSAGYSGPITVHGPAFETQRAALVSAARHAYQWIQEHLDSDSANSPIPPAELDRCKLLQRALLDEFGEDLSDAPLDCPPAPDSAWSQTPYQPERQAPTLVTPLPRRPLGEASKPVREAIHQLVFDQPWEFVARDLVALDADDDRNGWVHEVYMALEHLQTLTQWLQRSAA